MADNGRRYLTDEEIVEAAAKMRVADPNVDNGAFSSQKRAEMVTLVRIMGATKLQSKSATDAEVERRLRLALWDSQRLENYFPGKAFSKSPKLDPSKFPAWPDWKKPHPELRSDRIGAVRMDGFKDAARMDTYVFRHFTASAFTQMENMQGVPMNAPDSIQGSWIGVKAKMLSAALDITREGGAATPFVTFFANDSQGNNESMFIMEILDVRQVAWPEPTKKAWEQIRTCQETKFGHSATGPIVPMLQTPKMPLILVRYTYMNGRPEGGSQFTLHLQSRLAETMPGASPRKVLEQLQEHLGSGIETPDAHLRTFARLLSYNSSLLDPTFVDELQSHWNGISHDVIKETRISFFVPCLRLRWRALEEIESGIPLKPPQTTCNACGKPAERLICNSCKFVFYCGTDCNKSDWPNHKAECKLSKRLLTDPASFPQNKLYISARTYVDFVPESGYAIEQEAIKYSGSCSINDCPHNEYGNERFLVSTQMPATYSHNGQYQGQTVFLWDRRRSILLRTSPGDPPMARERGMPFEIPFHPQGYANYVKAVRQKGRQRQFIHLWAKRVGDCIELDLDDIPDQGSITWS
ncbi:hypothetical protein BDZ89DRAFT_672575 [Hymenopellis radicata]|nr:hypothetical protein BDZ89DRAFT_672575 [Hymenopellis radicata]